MSTEYEQYYKHNFLLTPDELGYTFVEQQKPYVQMMIDGAIDWVFQYTGLDTIHEKEELLDGMGGPRLMLNDYPCQTLLEVSIQTYKANNPLQGWVDVTNSVQLLKHGEIIMYPTNLYHWVFPTGTRNIRIRYIAGMTKIPPLIRMTIIELTQSLLLKSGLISAVGIGDAAGSSDLLTPSTGTITTTQDATKGIKSVSVKNLAVEFADDKRTLQELMNNPKIKQAAFTRMIEDILKDTPSYLARLNQISKVYMT